MPIITLTTDMGQRDYYAGVLKQSIYRQFPSVQIIDLSHDVKPFFIPGAALVVRSAYPEFPAGTVHLISVCPDRSKLVKQLAVLYKGHYFIGADNGMFPQILEHKAEKVVDLTRVTQNAGAGVFPSRDIFAVAACHLAKGGIMEVLGNPAEIVNEMPSFVPTIVDGRLRGMALHVDIYGNIITNISRKIFDTVGKGRPFEIRFRKAQHLINKIYQSYDDVSLGEKMALFGSSGLLEIAINRSNASQLLGVKQEDIITIVFK